MHPPKGSRTHTSNRRPHSDFMAYVTVWTTSGASLQRPNASFVCHTVPMEHVDREALEEGLEEIRRSPRESGSVELIVRRPLEEEREVLDEAELDPEQGVVGDRWHAGGTGKRERQLTLMNARAAALIAQTRERWPLAGDQLYVDLDLSGAHLPPGTRLEVGSAVVEVTPEPHTGCGKFSRRFGVDALKFVNSPSGRELNARGINARIVTAGTVRTGDVIRKTAT
jgi:MOSC domain-containing protein YiiM